MEVTIDILSISATLGFAALSTAFILVLVRLIRGPSLPDRVVALDTMAFLAIGFIALYTIVARESVLLDAATTLALIAFLGTVAFARYVQQRSQRAAENERAQRELSGGDG
jgi:multicomponent Na+:H+ antiporter subunit F